MISPPSLSARPAIKRFQFG
ncbi:hypothetical protein CGLO_12438 [Colletotrichum gloeosporioides Cg-14]|uniref:Uncharacterized protein n=1 Tax=Colletotrichum gloeosporioides (strain Cg-14) TaxID=1237896 RepID=T0L9K5_COLGC|nr:hypothetical protein CGLO_12438 [Colletotrichum gloeosporioides Cg-14]